MGSETITVAEFLTNLREAPDYYTDFLMTDHGRKRFIDVLVKEKLMIAEAKKLKLHKKAEYKKLIKEYRADLERQFIEYKNNILIQEYYQLLKAGGIHVTDSEIEAYYNKNIDKYKKPMTMVFSHILVSTQEKAQEIIDKLNKGESFDRIGKENTEGFWSDTEEGKLTFNQPGSLIPELEEAALSLKLKTFSEPIETIDGYYILRKDSQTSIKPISIEEANPVIQSILEKKKFDEIMAGLRQKYNVLIYNDIINKYFRSHAIEKAQLEDNVE
ncbi:MAG: peptidyl-prolyl cis-trans isomerase [bacterium]